MSKPSTTAVTVYDETFELPELTKWLSKVADQGYIVIPEWLTKERVSRLRHDLVTEINPIRELMRPDRTTVRAHNLLGKTRCVDDIVNDRRLIALAQGVLGPMIQVSVVAMFDLLPGAKAQVLHQDDGLWPVPRPHPPFVFNAVIAVEDFTLKNGGTMLVPESHKWDDRPVAQPPAVEPIQIEMSAGSLVAWNGAVWHGGGENKTRDQTRLALNINFNLSYLRQQENQYIGIPREELDKMPERLQRLVGYQGGISVAGAGMVDLRDPLEMLNKVSLGYDVNGPDMPPIRPLKHT